MDKTVTTYKEIGQRIRRAREEKGITQSKLGELLEKPLTATAISLYEAGDREVNLSVLSEIASILGVPLEFLIKGKLDAPSIDIALRADKDLQNSQKAQEEILSFIDYVKKKTQDK